MGILKTHIETGNWDHLNKQKDNPEPSIDQLMEWEHEGGCEATDGCWVEPDGTCQHGKPSWLLQMGMI